MTEVHVLERVTVRHLAGGCVVVACLLFVPWTAPNIDAWTVVVWQGDVYSSNMPDLLRSF